MTATAKTRSYLTSYYTVICFVKSRIWEFHFSFVIILMFDVVLLNAFHHHLSDLLRNLSAAVNRYSPFSQSFKKSGYFSQPFGKI